jgi:hypothetical protein
MTARMDQLLLDAATTLADGCSPLDRGFLVKHDVTLDEAYSLAECLALAVRVWVRTPVEDRRRHAIDAAFETLDTQLAGDGPTNNGAR